MKNDDETDVFKHHDLHILTMFIHVYTQGTSVIKGSTRKPKTITVYSSNFELINGVNLCKK